MTNIAAEEKASDVIRRRYSCRTYEDRPIESSLLEKARALIAELPGPPFKSTVRFTIAASSGSDSGELRGLGTYGFIKYPSAFIIGAMKESPRCLEDYGYQLERLVLGATALGLGTCWLGGSFSRSTFAQRIGSAPDEKVPSVIAMGYPADKRRAMEKIMRWAVNADNRLPGSEIFFDGGPERPLAPGFAKDYDHVLEMTRLAPSAKNLQPWRVIRDESGKAFRFYLARTKNYGENSFMVKADLPRIDMGIAMAHFELAARESGLDGQWEAEGSRAGSLENGWTYTATWRC